MNNFVILPILIPLLTGIFLIFLTRKVNVQRVVSLISAIISIVIAFSLVIEVKTDGIQVLQASNWDAPFGISIVADMLSALLVLVTSIIVFSVLIYSFKHIDADREKFFYYPLVQFLIVGVNGAFLTGDIFNLFVFFEVMLMSSYVLLVIGGTKIQLRETIKYLLVNVIASALFVVAVALLYSVVGTLNIADISQRIAEVEQPAIITVIAILFLVVFGLKGAIFPLYVWMPGSYYAPPIPILALFGALLTKVGIYSILRTFTTLFYHQPEYTHSIMLYLSILTIIFGCIGVMAYMDVKKIIIYNIVVAIGVILFGISVMNTEAIAGSVMYTLHDMLIKSALFLLIGIMIAKTGTSNIKRMGGLIHHNPLLGWMFFIAAISLAGVPPFSGFAGKLMIIQGAFKGGHYAGGLIVLFSSLIVLYSVMRIFIYAFWGEKKEYDLTAEQKKDNRFLMLPIGILIAVSIAYGIGTEAVYTYVSDAVQVLMNPSDYIQAVLKEG